MTLNSGSAGRTLQIGAALARILVPGDTLRLEGELGTGKTVLVRGMARSLGYEGPITSPTFTLINPYPEIALCHVDAFRLSGGDELLEAGIEEYLEGDWICAVEWADRVDTAMPARSLEVRLAFGEREEDRVINLVTLGGWDGREGLLAEKLGDHG